MVVEVNSTMEVVANNCHSIVDPENKHQGHRRMKMMTTVNDDRLLLDNHYCNNYYYY